MRCCCHPGPVRSQFGQSGSPVVRLVASSPLRLAWRSPERPADTLVWLSASVPGSDWPSGGYFADRKPATASRAADDLELARELWDASARMCAGWSRRLRLRSGRPGREGHVRRHATGHAGCATWTRGAARLPGHVTATLLTIVICQFMIGLDATVVNIALPKIRFALHFPPTSLAWVVSAYILAFGGLLLLGGRAGDVFGRRRMFTCGLSLFALASLFGGLATSVAWLLSARVAQGVGACSSGAWVRGDLPRSGVRGGT
jgi:hypothetical protein